MTQSFLATISETPSVPVPAPTPGEPNPSREPLKHLLIGSPEAVKNGIHSLHALDYAEVGAWSRLLPTANEGEVMSILVKYIVRQ
jgi:hypothetical protein